MASFLVSGTSPFLCCWLSHPRISTSACIRSLALILMLLLIGSVHPNPGPTSVKSIFNQAASSQNVFTSAFTDPDPCSSQPTSVPHLMDLNLSSSHSNHASSQPVTIFFSTQSASIPSLLSLNLEANQRNISASQNLHNASNHNPVSDLSFSQSASQPVRQSVRQSISQSANQLVSQPSSHPVASSSQPGLPPCRPTSHTFLQFNVNGIKNSLTEINSFLHDNQIKVACLQETRLSANAKNPSIPNYTVLRKDCLVGNGGGIAILVHHSVSFFPIDLSDLYRGDDIIEIQGVTATINNSPINIFNLYIPPSSSCLNH
jgi:hypothetical protein